MPKANQLQTVKIFLKTFFTIKKQFAQRIYDRTLNDYQKNLAECDEVAKKLPRSFLSSIPRLLIYMTAVFFVKMIYCKLHMIGLRKITILSCIMMIIWIHGLLSSKNTLVCDLLPNIRLANVNLGIMKRAVLFDEQEYEKLQEDLGRKPEKQLA